jgi:hypothetical protein
MTSPFPALSNDFLPLGFGCARLAGGRHKADSLRLLEAAYEAGIRYFDTARMYGYGLGEAEGVLGQFLSTRRNGTTSKAGILPTPNGVAIRWPRRAARLMSRVLPLPPIAPLGPRFGVFDVPALKKSLETSLRALRMDRLDALLLHEADKHDLSDGTVMALLEELRTAGKIGTHMLKVPLPTRRVIALPIFADRSPVQDGLDATARAGGQQPQAAPCLGFLLVAIIACKRLSGRAKQPEKSSAARAKRLRWTTRRHFLTTTGLMISPAPSSVPAATTMPSSAASGHRHCDQHYEDGRVHAASMYAASIFDTPQAWHSKT